MRNVSTSYVVTLSPFSNSNLTERQVPLFKMMHRLLVLVERNPQNPSSCVFQRVFSVLVLLGTCHKNQVKLFQSISFISFPFHAMTMISLVCCWLHDHWSAICSLCYNWICLHILIIKWLSVMSPAVVQPVSIQLHHLCWLLLNLLDASTDCCRHWFLSVPCMLWCSDASLATVNTNSGRIACYQLEAEIQQNKLK